MGEDITTATDDQLPVLELADVRAIRALAHPVRLALMEELAVTGPLTATEAAGLVGESPSSCSFHLRQLAKYGFVEEAGGSAGRNRPWRLVNRALRLRTRQEHEAEVAVGLSQLTAVLRQRALERLRTWWATKGSYPTHWRAAEIAVQGIWWATPDELSEMESELVALLARHRKRTEDPARRPPGAAPVELLAFAYPLRPPTGSPTTEDEREAAH